MSVRRGSAVQTNERVTLAPNVSLAEVRENKPCTSRNAIWIVY